MNTIYLVRHGENTANLTKEFSHKLVDYSLTPKGVLQAEQTAIYFKDKQIDAIYSSPLKRAYETANIIGKVIGLPVTSLEAFREVNVGAFEGQEPTTEIWAEHNRIMFGWLTDQPDVAFPEGENYHTLLERMRAGLRQIIQGKTGQHIVVVGHGGIFSVTLKDICQNVDMQELGRKENHNCAITAIELAVDDNGEMLGNLKEWAYCDHLQGDAANLISGFIRT